MGLVNRLVYGLFLFFDWISGSLSVKSALHTARFARPTELTPLASSSLSGASLLLGIGSFGQMLRVLSSDFGEQAGGDIWNPSTLRTCLCRKPFNGLAVAARSACEVDGRFVSLVACSPKSPDRSHPRAPDPSLAISSSLPQPAAARGYSQRRNF